jgi:hypothetical protein
MDPSCAKSIAYKFTKLDPDEAPERLFAKDAKVGFDGGSVAVSNKIEDAWGLHVLQPFGFRSAGAKRQCHRATALVFNPEDRDNMTPSPYSGGWIVATVASEEQRGAVWAQVLLADRLKGTGGQEEEEEDIRR